MFGRKASKPEGKPGLDPDKQSAKYRKLLIGSVALGVVAAVSGFLFPPIWAALPLAGVLGLYSLYKMVRHSLPNLAAKMFVHAIPNLALQASSSEISHTPEQQTAIYAELLKDLETIKAKKNPDMLEPVAYFLAQWESIAKVFSHARMLSPKAEEAERKIPVGHLAVVLLDPIRDAIPTEVEATLRQYGEHGEVSFTEAYAITKRWLKAWIDTLPSSERP